MKYQHTTTKEIKTYAQLKHENKNISFPKEAPAFVMNDWSKIHSTPQPTYDRLTEKLVELAPVDYHQVWEVQALEAQVSLDNRMRVWKEQRTELVDNIEVTYNTVIYQGDEISQARMSRTITALPNDTAQIFWTAKDNTVHALTRVDLSAMLLDAGTQQAMLWNDGRPV